MVITDRTNNPVYDRINRWLIEHNVININVYEMSEKEAYYWAMQEFLPGISMEITDEFWKVAQQLMR